MTYLLTRLFWDVLWICFRPVAWMLSLMVSSNPAGLLTYRAINPRRWIRRL